MVVTARDLDDVVKGSLRTSITQKLLGNYGMIPVSNDTEKIKEVIGASGVKEHLNSVIVAYYNNIIDEDINVVISADEMMRIYLHKI